MVLMVSVAVALVVSSNYIQYLVYIRNQHWYMALVPMVWMDEVLHQLVTIGNNLSHCQTAILMG